MKKILLSTLSFSILFADGVDVEKIVQKIETLKNFTISTKVNYQVYDPFATAKPILKRGTITRHIVKKGIVVETIFNHKAFLDGSWHSASEYIHGMKIIKVFSHGIVVLKGNKKVLIPLKREKNIIKTKEYIK